MWLTSANAALTIDNYTDAVNNRFSNDPSFILSDYDLSGIGRGSSGKWATMVSNNVFVSANHYHPATGETLYFYSNNDPNSTAITRTVVSGERILEDGSGNVTDIWAGVLNAPLPETIARYTYATERITAANFNSSSLHDQDAYLVGISPGNTTTEPGQDQGVGENVINAMAQVNFSDTEDEYLLMDYDSSGDPNYRTNEAYVNGGDSGSPLLVVDDGNLLLLGTASFQYNLTNGTDGSGYTYTGDSKDSLGNFITTSAVPEPSSLALFSLSAFLFWMRRR